MVLFDDEIKKVYDLLDKLDLKQLDVTDNLIEDVGSDNMIFKSDSAYELGEINSLSFELSSSDINIEDKLYLCGKDLNEIVCNEDFIRITLLNVRDDKLNGNALYDRLEKIKLTKYKISPKGYMLRTSVGGKEKVRVSKDLKIKGSFAQIGSAYLKEYKKLPYVNNVTIIFIVGKCDLYNEFVSLANKKKEISDTIDHILKGLMVNDCGACSVKDLCDEVQELREIHKENGKS